MAQEADQPDVGGLDEVTGYVLKQAAAALRLAMDEALRPLGLTVPQYACLELLSRSPGLSNADLARGAFVTRQSMNVVLRGLQEADLVRRPATVDHGRARPTTLTPAGRRVLRAAARAVTAIEDRMVERLTARQQQQLRASLAICAATLREHG
jgi:DNA-binding MarR family transcriptional regulator